jgi:DNA-binding CsgD family transcriptional regulator
MTMPRKTRPVLSPVQHHYLWLRATGKTERDAQKILGTTATYGITARIVAKFAAGTLTHAVYLAVQLDMIGPRLECGSYPGVLLHQKAREDLCRACLRANGIEIEREKDRADDPPVLTDLERRYLDLMAEGLSFSAINMTMVRKRDSLIAVRSGLYRKLGVSDGPKQHKAYRALEEARAYGLIPMRGPRRPLRTEVLRPRVTKLTDLEVRTLAALTEDQTLVTAGAALGIKPGHVSSRLAIIYRKLDVNHLPRDDKRAAAVKEARNRGYAI